MTRSALIRGAGQGRAARGAQKRARSELALDHRPVVQGRPLLQAHRLIQSAPHRRLLSPMSIGARRFSVTPDCARNVP